MAVGEKGRENAPVDRLPLLVEVEQERWELGVVGPQEGLEGAIAVEAVNVRVCERKIGEGVSAKGVLCPQV